MNDTEMAIDPTVIWEMFLVNGRFSFVVPDPVDSLYPGDSLEVIITFDPSGTGQTSDEFRLYTKCQYFNFFM